MKKTLEPFQDIGAQHLASRYRAMLADEPGLGKTVQAIAASERAFNADARSSYPWYNLVVCPASVRSGWLKEINECAPEMYAMWTIRSYNEIAANTAAYLKAWDTVIIDESHFCKSVESQRTRAVLGNGGVARRSRYIWCLTGTPVMNGRPVELYPTLKTLHKPFADMSFARYTQRYCDAQFNGRGMDVKGASNVDEFAGLLRGFMLRRTKKEVYPDRVEPLVRKIPLELDGSDLAKVIEAEDEIGGRELRLSSTHEKFSQLGDTSRLLRLLGTAKVRTATDFIEDKLQTVQKIVVFAHHQEVIRLLQLRFCDRGYRPVVYHGGMSPKAKDAARDQFIDDPATRVFIGNRVAAGVGINGLQRAASMAVIVEPSWVPTETEQMIGRLDRMGQEDNLVTAYILYARGTLDGVVVGVHDRKAPLNEKITKGAGL